MYSLLVGINNRSLTVNMTIHTYSSLTPLVASPATAVTARCKTGKASGTPRSRAKALASTIEFLICRPFKA
jgi:hypothetical protein